MTGHSQGQLQSDEAAWPLLLERAFNPATARKDGVDQPTVDTTNDFVDLYLPLCEPVKAKSNVLAHLGQSIDGYIATASGDSAFVNDRENIRHLHRLRALHQAVIVGAGTIAADNPRLTTRLVQGPNPVRVVLDPGRRLGADLAVFNDGAAPTLLVVSETTGGPPTHGQAEVLFAPMTHQEFDLAYVVEALAERNLLKLFVEGGGTTVSRFFDAGLLDRLQIAIAPVFIGHGKPGLRMAARSALDDCPRPDHRIFSMGRDILFDCDLSSEKSSAKETAKGRFSRDGMGNGSQNGTGDSLVPIRRIR